MIPVQYDKYEIIGFDGRLPNGIECGRSLPVVHLKETQVYIKGNKLFYMSDSTSVECYNNLAITLLAEEGRLTLLPTPVPMIPNAQVLYARESLLHTLDFDLTQRLQLPDCDAGILQWQYLNHDHAGAWVTAAPTRVVQSIMNYWGRQLQEKAETMLKEYFATQDVKYLEQGRALITAGRAAAKDGELRKGLHALAAVTLKDKPNVLSRVWELFVSREFPEMTRAEFDIQMETLEAKLRQST